MTSLYSEELVEKLKKRKKTAIISVVALMSAATVVNVILLILSNEYNATLMKIVTSAVFVLSGWVSIWLVFDRVVKTNKKLAIIEDLGSGDVVRKDVAIIKIDKPVTLPDSTACYDVTVSDGKKEFRLYFDKTFDIGDLKEGERASFEIVDDRIIAYEVIDDER